MKSYGQICSVAKALDVVGDRWSLLIVRELALQGPCRYTDLQRGLPGIATNLLSARLRELQAAGVVAKEQAPPPVATTLFSLTELGAGLRPVLAALGQWGAHFVEQSLVAAMADPGAAAPDQFRSHWLALPVSMFFPDQDASAPAVTVEVRTGDERPMLIERVAGRVVTRPAAEREVGVDLSLAGAYPLVLGVLSGRLPAEAAAAHGLVIDGDLGALERLRMADAPV